MYTTAICRKPGPNFAEGLTTSTLGIPDFSKAIEQHKAYCTALEEAGIEVILLESDNNYPDGCFVEDTAIITEDIAIITQPGDPARMGEQDKIADLLSNYKKLAFISGSGRVDGGDILRAEKHFYIGLSKRTNPEGTRQLAHVLNKHGFLVTEIPVAVVLHLKSAVSYLTRNTVITMKEYADFFPDCTIIEIDDDESYAANCLVVNDYLFISKGYPKTKNQLKDLGFQLIELDMSEFQKMDGSLTCLSLLF